MNCNRELKNALCIRPHPIYEYYIFIGRKSSYEQVSKLYPKALLIKITSYSNSVNCEPTGHFNVLSHTNMVSQNNKLAGLSIHAWLYLKCLLICAVFGLFLNVYLCMRLVIHHHLWLLSFNDKMIFSSFRYLLPLIKYEPYYKWMFHKSWCEIRQQVA